MRPKPLSLLFIGNKAVTRIRLLHIELIYTVSRNLMNYLLTKTYFSLNRKYLCCWRLHLMLPFFSANVYVFKKMIFFSSERSCFVLEILRKCFGRSVLGLTVEVMLCFKVVVSPLTRQSWRHLLQGEICWVTKKPCGELCSAGYLQQGCTCLYMGWGRDLMC